MGKKTTRKSDTLPEQRPVMAKHAHDLLQGEYADLPGDDQAKCRDKALLEAVRKKMGWDYAPGGAFLFDELRLYREQLNAPEPEKPKRREPKRRGAPSSSPPPPAKRSTPKPAPAKPAPHAGQDPNQGESGGATAEASSKYPQFCAAVDLAKRAQRGDTFVPSGCKPRACEVRRVGDKKWRKFASRTDAAAAFPSISREDVTKLCNKKASPALLAKGLEARDVDEGGTRSKREPYASVLSGAGFRFNYADVGSDAGALSVVQRGAWDQSPPESWEDALKSLGELDEQQFLKFAAATAEAEEARVRQVRTAALRDLGDAARDTLRRKKAAAGARATEEAHNELVEEELFDEGGVIVGIKVHEDNVDIFLKDKEHQFRDDEEVWVKYKDKWVILKAGPWPKRYAFGSARGALRVAAARTWRGKPGEAVATLRRETVGVAIAMTREAADGTEGWAHGGIDSKWALTASPREKPKDNIRGLEFDSVEAMCDIGFLLRSETPATRDDGEPLDGGFTKCRFALDPRVGTWGAFATESDRLRDRLLMTSPVDRRLDNEGAVATFRRNTAGAAEPGTVALWLSTAHRASGPSRHWTALHNFLRRERFPIYAELMRRGNIHCVPLEFLAYRDPTKGGPFHVDAATIFLLSQGGMTSATMAAEA